MAGAPDSRGFSRIGVHPRLTMELQQGVVAMGTVADVSMSGARVSPTVDVEVGAEGPFDLVLGDDEHAIHVRGVAKVVRVTDDDYAVVFTELDHDGYIHLSRLVLYNAADVERIEAELKAHVGLRRR